jgi:hypothetical protein
VATGTFLRKPSTSYVSERGRILKQISARSLWKCSYGNSSSNGQLGDALAIYAGRQTRVEHKNSIEVFLQEHSFVQPFGLFSVKLEKCSCRNTVEN